ncbi:carboxylate--amine ligase [Halorubrum sp. DTA98]|uniref:carboxylate--amine ligase n=1 Tax=Halorubrum sp. DTA98 TaxID=3402163 RepID=UPI003AAE14AD
MVRTGTSRNAAVIPVGFEPAAYSCVRSLSRRGVDTIVASEYDDTLAAASRFCDEFVSIPSPYEDLIAYRDALVGLAARDDVETIYPLRAQDAYVFTRYADAFAPYVSLVTPSADLLGTVFDRVELVAAAEEAGVPAPETRLLTDVDEWDRDLIIKSRYNLLTDEYCPEFSPRDVATAKSVTHVAPGEDVDVEAFESEMHHMPIVQEYVPSSDEYLFGALYDDGEPVTTFQHRQVRGDSYTGGGGVYREATRDPELERVGRTLLDHLEFDGLACIEYMKHAETGEYVLTEINPRLWQSLPSAVQAGADFPASYWEVATGAPVRSDFQYEVGVGTHLLYGELGHLISIVRDESPFVDPPSLPRTAWEIAASCVKNPYFDVLRADDPKPFVQGLVHVLKT